MDLQARLGGYEVTAVPQGQPSLALVWSEDVTDVLGEVEDGAGGTVTGGVLAILDDYRITRVPGRAAS